MTSKFSNEDTSKNILVFCNKFCHRIKFRTKSKAKFLFQNKVIQDTKFREKLQKILQQLLLREFSSPFSNLQRKKRSFRKCCLNLKSGILPAYLVL